MPPLRPLHHLLQITSPRWGSKPQPIHAFQIQRYLSRGGRSEEKGFPYLQRVSASHGRTDLLGRLSFPREYMPTLGKIWWTTKWTPLLLFTLIYYGLRDLFCGRQIPRPPTERRVVVKSRIGRFFYDIVGQPECFELLNTTIQPWGCFRRNNGNSMQPTLGGNPAILYTSYAYRDSQDVKLGDVVLVLGPDYDDTKRHMCKRVAALAGDRIWTTGPYRTHSIVLVRTFYFFTIIP